MASERSRIEGGGGCDGIGRAESPLVDARARLAGGGSAMVGFVPNWGNNCCSGGKWYVGALGCSSIQFIIAVSTSRNSPG